MDQLRKFLKAWFETYNPSDIEKWDLFQCKLSIMMINASLCGLAYETNNDDIVPDKYKKETK